MTEYKVGDWVFYEFRLVQIKEIEEGKVTQISDGFFSTFGLDLGHNIVPLTLKNKCVSDRTRVVYENLYESAGSSKWKYLNWPEIHPKFVSLWLDLCNNLITKDEISYDCIYDLKDKILAAIDLVNKIRAEGIRLFR